MFVRTDACFPVTYAERRRAPRRRPARETVARLLDVAGADLGTGLVWNLSRSGVSLLLHRALEPGEHVDMELVGAGAASLRVGMSVVHRNELRTGDFVLGGHFDRPLDDEELAPFVA